MENVRTGYIKISDGELYFEMAGEGQTLIFIHAGFVDSRMWEEQWKKLSRSFRVIRYDQRGFGRSSRLFSPVNRRKDLACLVKELNIQQAVLIGCSMGGEIALDFSFEYPEFVTGLFLVSTVPGGFQYQGKPPDELIQMIEALQKNDLDRASELQMRLWVDGPFRRPQEVEASLRQRAAEMNRIALNNATWLIVDSQTFEPLVPQAVNRLEEIRIPVCILDGALDNPEVLRAADWMAGRIPTVKEMIIPASAHLPSMEKPEIFNQALLDFLADIHI